ncbi:hypothetical protein Tco_1480728 [Tanacetum coccineum]
MSGLKTCSAAFSAPDGFTDPGTVDPFTFKMDPLESLSVDDLTKDTGLVPLVEALLLSNPKPILQLDVF